MSLICVSIFICVNIIDRKYLLNGRRMILNEREDLDTWLNFATLCRKGGNSALAERVLQMTQRMSSIYNFSHATDSASEEMDRRIKFAMLRQQWAVGDRQSALQGLESLIQQSYSLPTITASGHGMRLDGHRFDITRSSSSAPTPPPVSQLSSSYRNSYLGLPTSFIPSVGGASDGSKFLSKDYTHVVTHSNPQDAAVHLECLLMLGEWKIGVMGPDEAVDPITRRLVCTQ